MLTIAMTKVLGKAPELSMKTNLPLTQQQLLEKVLYILSKTGGLDYYRVFKVLYFAERSYLAKYCRKMVEDSFYALEYGPVPTKLYDAVRHKSPLSQALWEVVQLAKKDAPTVLLPLREPDMDYISQREAETLDASIKEYSRKTFNELKELSHGSAWNCAPLHGEISSEAIALEGGLDADALPYLREQLEWQAMEEVF